MLLSCCCGNCDDDGRMCSLVWCKLPDDLIIEVLCRLPDKPLVQFKCVSKAWNFFITNFCVPRLAVSAPLSEFVFRFDSVFGLRYGFLTSEGHYDTGFFKSFAITFPFRLWAPCVDIIGCFNGLVLVSRPADTKEFYVCNPATKQCVSIPVNPNHRKNSFVGMAFNPIHSCPQNNTYKIIRIARSSGKSDLLPDFEVFLSVTGKWGSYCIPLEPRIIGSKWLRRSVDLNGNFYVLSYSRYILCFDLRGTDDEKLSACAIELPVKARTGDGQHLGLISLSNECLYYSSDDESMFHIWSLEVGGSNATSAWILMYSVSIDKLRQLPHGEHLSPSFLPFVIDPASKVIYLGNRRVVLKYNIQTNKLEILYRMVGTETIFNGRSCFHPYRRSLVMLSDFRA